MSTEAGGNGLAVTGWGTTLKAQGRDVIFFLLISGLSLVVYRGFEAQTAREDNRVREHQAILDAQNNLACVLLMAPEERGRFAADPQKVCDYLQVIRGGDGRRR